MAHHKKIVLGIDPGFGSLGYAILSIEGGSTTVVDFGCVSTPPSLSFPKRLLAISDAVDGLITTHAPTCVAIERLFFEKNTKTAIDVAQARGAILLASVRADLPIIECTPLQVKLAVTGYGKAEKKQVQQMMKLLLKLPALPKQDDAADALAIAYCGSVMN